MGAGGKKQPLLPMPLPLPTKGRDMPEIKEFRCCCPNCNVYVDRAAHDGSTNAQGEHRGGSPVDNNNDDDRGDNNNGGGAAKMPDGVGDKFEAPLQRDEAEFGPLGVPASPKMGSGLAGGGESEHQQRGRTIIAICYLLKVVY